MLIQSTSNISTQLIKGLVYAPSGNGKTTLAKTLKKYNPLVISAEAGMMSLAGSGVDYIDITKDDKGDLLPKEKRADRLKEVYQYVQSEEAKKKYSCLVLDSITEMGQLIQGVARLAYPDEKQNFQMWGKYGEMMRDLVKAFRDLPGYHVIFICLSTIDKDENGRRYAAFDLSGKIGEQLPAFFDLVMYLHVDAESRRTLVCQPTDAIFAKDRSSKLDRVEPADLGLVFNKMLGVKND